MSEAEPGETIEHVSVVPFQATLERLIEAIARAGLILFDRIDHAAGALQAGLEMPPSTVLTYGHPKGGTPLMLAAPLAALDLPLRVLVRVREDGRTAIGVPPDRRAAPQGRSARHRSRPAGPGTAAPGARGDAMSEAQTLVVPGRPMLEYLPVGLFGSVMGLTGLSVAWRLAHGLFGTPEWIALLVGVLAVVAFVLLLAAYGVKLATAPAAVRAEFHHPIAGNLFGTILISLLLLPILLAPVALRLAQVLWTVGAIGMVLFAWLIVSRWMSDRQQVAHATPAWIIPLVGMLDVPLALPVLGLPPVHGVMVLALAVGLFLRGAAVHPGLFAPAVRAAAARCAEAVAADPGRAVRCRLLRLHRHPRGRRTCSRRRSTC